MCLQFNCSHAVLQDAERLACCSPFSQSIKCTAVFDLVTDGNTEAPADAFSSNGHNRQHSVFEGIVLHL